MRRRILIPMQDQVTRRGYRKDKEDEVRQRTGMRPDGRRKIVMPFCIKKCGKE